MVAELRLEVGRDGVPACEFVRLNWPRDLVAPRLSTTGALMTLELEFDTHSVRALQRLLTEAGATDRRLAQSSRRLRMQLASRTVGKVVPESRVGYRPIGEAPPGLHDSVRR
jgi:hypothetical protein